MLTRIMSRILKLLRGIDALAEKVLRSLQRLYDVLTRKLDTALDKLDQLTKSLLRKYYRALDYLERLFKILQRLLRVLFPIVLLFVPTMAGYVITYFSYAYSKQDAVIIGSMNTVLLLILVASFRSKAEDVPEQHKALAVWPAPGSVDTRLS